MPFNQRDFDRITRAMQRALTEDRRRRVDEALRAWARREAKS